MASNEIFSQLFDLNVSKSQRTRLEIAEAAIKSYVELGIEGTNFGTIADRAGLSRTIVVRYFSTMDDLFTFVAKVIRVQYQQFVIQRFSEKASVVDRLETYVTAALDWVDEIPDHAKVSMLFLYQSGIKKEYRTINTEMVDMGHKRLRGFLAEGQKSGEFKVKSLDPLARQLHLALSGAIMAKITEDKGYNTNIKRDLLRLLRNLLGY